jgi:thioredoxin 1
MALSTKTFAMLGVMAVVAVAVLVAKTQTASLTPAAPATTVPIGAPAQSANAPAAVTTAAHPKRRLLFFMNPNGIPCQTQWGLLNNVADSLLKVADVVYIKTTEPADYPKFETFGIRGLPSLVITDENGRELSRFSPGIQPADAVLAALTK